MVTITTVMFAALPVHLGVLVVLVVLVLWLRGVPLIMPLRMWVGPGGVPRRRGVARIRVVRLRCTTLVSLIGRGIRSIVVM